MTSQRAGTWQSPSERAGTLPPLSRGEERRGEESEDKVSVSPLFPQSM